MNLLGLETNQDLSLTMLRVLLPLFPGKILVAMTTLDSSKVALIWVLFACPRPTLIFQRPLD